MLLREVIPVQFRLPRFFFQRIYRTKIKVRQIGSEMEPNKNSQLIISPQPSDARGVFRVSSTDLLPVLVEGIIDSDNPKAIDSVCAIVTLRRDNVVGWAF